MKPRTISHLRPATVAETKPSSYDRTSAVVLAGILLVGFLFCVLFSIWLTTDFDFSRRTVTPTPPSSDWPTGSDEEIVEPGVQEFPEIATPQLAPALLAVTEAVSTVKASTHKRTGKDSKTGFGIGLGHRDIIDKTLDEAPAHKRWTIGFQSKDLTTYADQLSYFNIDIGVVHTTQNTIWRIKDPGGKIKVIQSNRHKENKTLRFQQTKRRMRLWDQQLCKQADVDTDAAVLCQFYPDSTKALLAQVEAEAIAKGGRKLKEVKKTNFKIIPDGDGFKFEVDSIEYH